MGVTVQVKTDADKVKSEFKGVGDEARKAKEEAKALGDEVKKAVGGPAVRDATGKFQAMGASVAGLRTKVLGAAQASEAFNARMRASEQHAERLRNQLSPLEKNFQVIATEMKRQEDILKRIRGPQQDYNRDVASLNSLMKQGKISAKEYADELARVDGKLQSSQRSEEPGMGKQLARGHGGTAGNLAMDALEGGMAGIGGKLASIGIDTAKRMVNALIDLGDAYTDLENSAKRVANEGESLTGVIDSQYASSVKLHSSLHETLELLDAVRDGTNELNYTTREQAVLADSIGATIRLEGKSLSEASGLMTTLSFAMANGTITGRELKNVMKQYPDLASAMAESTGKSRAELIKMANDGKFTGEMLTDQFTKSGAALQDKLGDRLETTGEKWQHFKDKTVVAWGGISQTVSVGLGAMIDGLSSAIDPLEEYRAATERAVHAAQFEAEIEKKITANREKLIKTSQMLAAMKKNGIDAGPLDFDVSVVENYERLRSTMIELGVTMDSVWTDANAKQVIYAREAEKITEAREAEKQAEQIKQVWKELNDVNDILEAQRKKYKDVTDKAAEYAGALKKIREENSMRGSGPLDNTPQMFTSGVADTREAVILQREEVAVKREKLVMEGKLSQSAADALNKQDQLRDGLKDLNADLRAGTIDTKTYAEALKGLGVDAGFTADFLTKLNEPAINYAKTVKAINFLFKTGKIDAQQYVEELKKISEATPTRTGEQPKFGVGPKKMGGVDMNVGYESAPKGLEASKSVTDGMEVKRIELGFQLNEQLEHQRAIMEKLIAPQRQYEQTLEAINGLLATNAITQAQATALTKEAVATYKAAALSTAKAETATQRWNRQLAELRQNGRGSFEGMKNGLNEIKNSLDEAAKMQDIMKQAFDGVVDGIANAAGAGQDAMASLEASGRALVKTLLVEFTKLMIIKGLAGAFGGPTGGMPPLPGFASGGMIQPGGSGGTDSQIVAFRKSPDETVRITTPGQEKTLRGGGGGKAAPAVVKVFNIDDPSRVPAAMDTRRGQRQIVNTMQQSRRTVRGTVSRG